MTQTTPTRDEAVPTGWRLVPIEPTPKMLQDAAFNLSDEFGADFVKPLGDFARALWKELLASAPAPASGGVDAVRQKLEWVKLTTLEPWTRTSCDEALLALSPAATPASEAEPVAQWQWADSSHAAWFDGEPPFGTKPHEVTRRTLYALAKPAAGGDVVPGLRAEIAHDGFSGDIIGRYVTREGKRGAVVQQDGTRVVHVYGEKWLPVETQIALSQSTSAGRVGE